MTPEAISMRGSGWRAPGPRCPAEGDERVVRRDEVQHRAVHVVRQPPAAVAPRASASRHMLAPKPAPSSESNIVSGTPRDDAETEQRDAGDHQPRRQAAIDTAVAAGRRRAGSGSRTTSARRRCRPSR